MEKKQYKYKKEKIRIHINKKQCSAVPMQEMQETQVWFLGWEDPLEEGMAVNSSILAWRSPWTEEPDGLQSTGSQRVRHDWSDLTHSYLTLLLQSKSSLDNTETSEHGCAIIKLYLWTQKFQLHIIFTLFTLFFFEFFSTISKCKSHS